MESDRIHVRLPNDWHEAISTQAYSEGKSVSEWIRTAIRHRLPNAVQKHLSEVKVGRPKSTG